MVNFEYMAYVLCFSETRMTFKVDILIGNDNVGSASIILGKNTNVDLLFCEHYLKSYTEYTHYVKTEDLFFVCLKQAKIIWNLC